MRRDAHGLERVGGERVPVIDEGIEQAAIGFRVIAQCRRGVRNAPLQQRRRLVLERMRERHRRNDPLEPVLGERKLREERRVDRDRMHRRAHIVMESGERELLGARSAADGGGRLVHANGESGARERDRGREAVGSAAYDDCVDGSHVPCKLPESYRLLPHCLRDSMSSSQCSLTMSCPASPVAVSRIMRNCLSSGEML